MKLNNYPIKEFSKLVNRLDFSKVHYANFTPPDLKGIQIEAYGRFIKDDLIPLLEGYFPLYSQSKNTCITLEDIIVKEPEVSEDEALETGQSYQFSIYLKIKLVSKQGKDNDQTAEDTIFLGNLPKLTKRYNFIINGIEKFIISQIIRAPGVYVLNKSQIKLSTSKKKVQEGTICELLAIKGSTMIINYVKDRDGESFVRVTAKNNVGDSFVQFPMTVLLKALGMCEAQILEICGENSYVRSTLNKEDYNPQNLIYKDSSWYMKWFKTHFTSIKDLEK